MAGPSITSKVLPLLRKPRFSSRSPDVSEDGPPAPAVGSMRTCMEGEKSQTTPAPNGDCSLSKITTVSGLSLHPRLQHMQALDGQLTFYQKHFTKPVVYDGNVIETYHSRDNRRFAFTSVGFLSSASVMLVLILGAIAAAVAATIENHKQAQRSQGPESPIQTAILANFPDPAIWFANGTWYAYATNSGAGVLGLPWRVLLDAIDPSYGVANIQMATSNNFINWSIVPVPHDPLPLVGAWALPPRSSPKSGNGHLKPGLASGVWAPGVFRRPLDNRYVLYYTATSVGTNPRPGHNQPHCIGAAISESDSPAGPFTAINSSIACPVDQGGAIDPEALVDSDGTIYAMWKVDGNNFGNGGQCGNTVKPIMPTPIMLQQMEADGVTTVGDAVQILDRTSSDGPLVEAPMIVRSPNGTYFLFFSSGCTRDRSYSIKYATAKNVTGPYFRAQSALLQSGDWGLEAPGSAAVYSHESSGYYMAFHARVQDRNSCSVRAMFTTKLQFDGDAVTMAWNDTGLTSP